MSDIEQPILIITGMHRSGTSLTASLLESAGLDIGKNLLPAGEGNPKGHFENIDFLDFHQNVLSSLGIDKVGWTTQNKLIPPPYFLPQAQELINRNKSLTQPWGWKEPRTTLFLDFWANLIPSARFLFIFRSPWEVVDSIYRRGDVIFHQNPYLAIQSWDSYNQAILSFYEQNCDRTECATFSDRCLIYNLNQIIIDPQNLIEDIREKFGISLSQLDKNIYEKELLKQDISSSFERPWLIKNYFPLSLKIYQQLNQLANYEDPIINQLPEVSNADLWSLQDWLNIHLLKRQLKGEINHLEQVYQRLGSAEAKIQELESMGSQFQTDNQKLEIDVNNLTPKYEQDLTNLIAKYDQDLINLTAKYNQDLTDLTAKYDQELATLQEKYQNLLTDFQELNYKNAELISINEQLKLNLEQNTQKSEELKLNLDKNIQELSYLKAEVEQLNFHISHLNSVIEDKEINYQGLQNQCSDLQNYIQQLEQNSAQKQLELEQILHQEKQQREIAQARITAMETSKFWQLRRHWFKLKKVVGMGENE